MMKKNVIRSTLSVLALVVFAGMALPGCSSSTLSSIIKPPSLESLSPRIVGIDFGGVNLEFDAAIRNTLPVPIKTPRFRYEISIEGSSLASGTLPSGLELPAGGVGTATLPVRISYADVFAIARTLKDKSEAGYQLSGAFLIPALGQEFSLPLSHSGTLPVLKAPSFADLKIGKPEISLNGARFALTARITNPNVFPLGLKGMGYDVSLGELSLGGLSASTAETVGSGETTELRLAGEVSLLSAAFSLISGGKLGEARIAPTGAIETPWGAVPFAGGR